MRGVPKRFTLSKTANAAGGDDTIFLRRQAIFLGYCFKHVTGGFVAPWVARRISHRYSKGTGGVREPEFSGPWRVPTLAVYYASWRRAPRKMSASAHVVVHYHELWLKLGNRLFFLHQLR